MINIITVNTYQSFGVHLFSTLLVHVIYLYIYISKTCWNLAAFWGSSFFNDWLLHPYNQSDQRFTRLDFNIFSHQKTRFIRNLGILPGTRSHPLSFHSVGILEAAIGTSSKRHLMSWAKRYLDVPGYKGLVCSCWIVVFDREVLIVRRAYLFFRVEGETWRCFLPYKCPWANLHADLLSWNKRMGR